ncbi:MAG: imidazolonepropionase [Nitrospinota bacterium]
MERADLLLDNASEVVTCGGASDRPKRGEELREAGVVRAGAVAVSRGRIVEVGPAGKLAEKYEAAERVDARGRVILPGFVDSHTHLVHAASRHLEYEQKIAGESYAAAHGQIGKGIRYTVEKTREASAEDLTEKALADLDRMLLNGTTTVEGKSGYGLDRETERKQLEVTRALDGLHPASVLPTYLGAHTVPEEFQDNPDGYVDRVISLLPEMRELADFCDVFCDPLGFSVAQTRRIFERALKEGYRLKVHAEQTAWLGGVEMAAGLGAVSADHLDYVSEAGMAAMAESGTMAVLLPGVTFHLMEMTPKAEGDAPQKPFLPSLARRLIESGAPVALATDYNPGSCRTQSMQAVMWCAARLFRMTYAECINASTINAAHALGLGKEIGSIEAGKRADLLICDCAAHGEMIDNFGVNLVDTVIKDGRVVVRGGVRVGG